MNVYLKQYRAPAFDRHRALAEVLDLLSRLAIEGVKNPDHVGMLELALTEAQDDQSGDNSEAGSDGSGANDRARKAREAALTAATIGTVLQLARLLSAHLERQLPSERVDEVRSLRAALQVFHKEARRMTTEILEQVPPVSDFSLS